MTTTTTTTTDLSKKKVRDRDDVVVGLAMLFILTRWLQFFDDDAHCNVIEVDNASGWLPMRKGRQFELSMCIVVCPELNGPASQSDEPILIGRSCSVSVADYEKSASFRKASASVSFRQGARRG